MRPFDLLQPRSVADVVSALQENGDDAQIIAGGAMMLILLREGLVSPRVLVSISDVAELSGVTETSDGVRIGSGTTLRALEQSALIVQHYPVLHQTLGQVANVRVRNVATIGGHLAQADPHLDLPPVLMALGATLELRGPAGTRTVPVGQFFTGYYDNALNQGEIIESITVPVSQGWQGAYLKYCALSPTDWPTVGVAALIRANQGQIEDVRIVAGSVGEGPVRVEAAESLLVHQPLSMALLNQVADAYTQAADPLGDVRGSVEYKRKMTGVFVRRAVRAAAQQAGVTL